MLCTQEEFQRVTLNGVIKGDKIMHGIQFGKFKKIGQFVAVDRLVECSEALEIGVVTIGT